jgi:hypothetical protein
MDWNKALVIDRYIGATSNSCLPFTLLLTIIQEIKASYPSMAQKEIPTDPKRLFEEFSGWLDDSTHEGPLLLVLDGLNQIIDDGEAHMLSWLPRTFPRGMRVVVSTVSRARTHMAVLEREWRQCEIAPLSDDSRAQLIAKFLGHYGKKLDEKQEQRV